MEAGPEVWAALRARLTALLAEGVGRAGRGGAASGAAGAR